MFRRLFLLTAAIVAFSSALLAPPAFAQGQPTCRGVLTQPTPTPAPSPTAAPSSLVGTDSATAATEFSTVGCADAAAYPGPFTNMPTTPASPYAAPRGIAAPEPLAAVAVAPATETTPVGGSGLAHSGSEVAVLAYLGTGLLAFGAVAMGLRRGSLTEYDA